MAQLSRPYQIALLALMVLVAAFLALGRHPSSTGGSAQSSTPAGASAAGASHAPASPSSAVSAATTTAEEKAAAAATPVYHGAAPGVEGLSRDIARAHGAVATSQGYDRTAEEKAASASSTQPESASVSSVSGSTDPSPATAPGVSPAAAAAKSTATVNPKAPARLHAPAAKGAPAATKAPAATEAPAAPKAPALSKAHTGKPASAPAKPAAPAAKPAAPAAKPAAPSASGTPATPPVPSGQQAVEHTLARGKVAVLLFWNPAGATDVAVHGQVQELGKSRLPVEVYEGTAEEVAAYGAITAQVPVYGTPTILIIADNGRTTSLTGLQGEASIKQAIEEARA